MSTKYPFKDGADVFDLNGKKCVIPSYKTELGYRGICATFSKDDVFSIVLSREDVCTLLLLADQVDHPLVRAIRRSLYANLTYVNKSSDEGELK